MTKVQTAAPKCQQNDPVSTQDRSSLQTVDDPSTDWDPEIANNDPGSTQDKFSLYTVDNPSTDPGPEKASKCHTTEIIQLDRQGNIVKANESMGQQQECLIINN